MKIRITKWHKQGLWDDQKVRDAVSKGILTKAQYEEITGKSY